MNEWIMQHEIAIRLACFFGVLALMASWEILAPRRPLTASKTVRWLNNLSLVLLNSILQRWLFPIAAVGLAVLAKQQQWGILNNIDLPAWLAIIVAIVLLDCVIYLQHVMFHALPLLWRLHRMHHADVDFDVTTGSRFHPVEIILSMLIKFATIMALGPPAVAVLLFEVILNVMAMFNHSNIALPVKIDKWLRGLIVTPDMHRVHHSVLNHETNSNFGFNLSLWDRLFGTYQAQPTAGHHAMQIGLEQFREPKYLTLHWLLVLPWLKTTYINNVR
ncbi:MAG: sterol desaturase family protein [Candidatus Parabeggiatoa sp. nov. 1]|nr:MAG: sterol desaturase family protein [Gammaproteobacteria bacterium]